MVAAHSADDDVMGEVPTVSLKKQNLGASPIDGKTPIHFMVGIVAGMSGLSASWAAVAVLGFEALIITLDEASLSAAFEKRSPQSQGNQAIDIMAGIAGVYYGELIKQRQDRMAVLPIIPTPVNLLPAAVNTEFPTTNVEPITQVSGVPYYR